jgi:hypothetical protein
LERPTDTASFGFRWRLRSVRRVSAFLKDKRVTESAVSGNDSTPTLPGPWRKDIYTALILILFCIVVYNANFRLISAGDNYPARYLPFGILKYRSVSLDPIATITAQGDAHPYWVVDKYGPKFSRYPIAVPVLVTPLYLPAAAYLHWQGWTDHELNLVARIMEKLVSSFIASLSVAFMYLLLVWRARCPWALWLTIAYGFGCNTWMISSQALWQHGVAELLLVAAVFILLGPCTGKRCLGAGLILGLIACARPPDVILGLALGLFGIRWARARVWLFVIGAAIPLMLLVAYNYHVAHRFVGGYGVGRDLSFFRYSLPCGVLGLFFSPARGLFIFSPFLLLLPFCLRYTFRDPHSRTLAVPLLIAVIAQVLLYAKLDWRAGCAWGPRWLTDTLPLLVWMLAAGFASLGRIGRTVFVLTTCISIWVQIVGAFWYTGESDAVIMKSAGDPNQGVVWDISSAPFVVELGHDPAPRELMLQAEGFVDSVLVGGHDVTQIIPGTPVEILGWALTDGHTPTAVRVRFVAIQETKWRGPDHYPIEQTTSFLERPDVTQTKHGMGPAGWRIVLKTGGLDPGPHRFEVFAQGNKGGEFRAVAQRPLLVLPAQSSKVPAHDQSPDSDAPVGITALSNLARDRLTTRQDISGYWLTAYTQSLQFDHPAFEMNTFTTAMIVDVLAPVAKAARLNQNVERARRHLFNQIEPSGLVRYHGRADSPSIPSLGCLITPDADDTALVWRITGREDDPRHAHVLETLKCYQTRESLYQTWLAPREQYRCVDPGQDPNPTDVGIQMHVLMFLAQTDPAAAEALRQALQSAVEEDRIWVYYKKTPLVPLLREADLRKLNYAVTISPNRLQTSVSGQEPWIKACHLLARYVTMEKPRPSAAETHELLNSLAKDNFAAVRFNPPLFYHNDLTAKVRRFYWSEDFGYALWLRLWMESSIVAPQDGSVGHGEDERNESSIR